MTSITIDIPNEEWKKLEEEAKKKGFDIKIAIEMVITTWINQGGIYVGDGPRIVIEWPRFFLIKKV